jgi:hypothetical protein
MSDPAFHKILCIHCSGKIEFPAEYAGQTILCPHCQKPVQLKAPPPPAGAEAPDYPPSGSLSPEEIAKGQKAKWHIIYAVAILVGVNLVLGAVYFFRPKSGGPLEGVQVTDWKLEPGEYKTFYVSGTVSNATSKAIAKARIEFETLDSAGEPTGTVSSVVSNLTPNASTSFSALTSPTQTVWDARLKGIFAVKE